ncbi:MAG: tripartite tricarboxylate transporter substrate binding protein [Burkholderiales bacterium]
MQLPRLLLIAVCSLSSSALAQTYPSKPIRLIAPFPPGGATDIMARATAQKIQESVGQNVIVDNRPGAGGNIGAEIAAKTPADGYTLLMGSTAHAINVSLYKKPGYDLLRDFAPISQVAVVANVLVVNPTVPAKRVQDLIKLARAQPGKLNMGSSGNGSVGHLAGELLSTLARIKVLHVPYKGSAPVLTELMAGQVDYAFESVLATLPHIRAGKLHALATTGTKRSELLSDQPTMIEAGLAGFEASGWSAVLAPAGTPQAVIATLNGAIVKGLATADVRERLKAQGAEPVGSTPAELEAFLRRDVARWAKLVQVSGATAD